MMRSRGWCDGHETDAGFLPETAPAFIGKRIRQGRQVKTVPGISVPVTKDSDFHGSRVHERGR